MFIEEYSSPWEYSRKHILRKGTTAKEVDKNSGNANTKDERYFQRTRKKIKKRKGEKKEIKKNILQDAEKSGSGEKDVDR